jgi:subtilisin family serine protease
MATININDATQAQIAVLLDLRPDEADVIAKGRPFKSVFDFRRALPFRVALSHRSLDIEKISLGSASEHQLVASLGIAETLAQAIVRGGPYYTLASLRAVPGATDALVERVGEFYAADTVAYTDKLSGAPVKLTADLSKLVVVAKDTESAGFLIPHSLTPTSLGSKSMYRVYDVSEVEDAGDAVKTLLADPAIDKVLPAFRDGGTERFLDSEYCTVRFSPTVSVSRQEEILTAVGAAVATRHRSPGLVTARVLNGKRNASVLTSVLRNLNAYPEVRFAEPSYIGFDDMEGFGAVVSAGSSGTAPASWNLSMIRAKEAWQFGKGSPSVVVAVVDSGVDGTHPALRSAVLKREVDEDWNFVDDSREALDEIGHGTFVSGIVIGDGTDGVIGVAPGCRLLPLKVPLSGSAEDYARRADAIEHAVSRSAGARVVISLSWKTAGDVAVVRDAIAAAIARGAVVVASAGNWPSIENERHFPSDYASVISVAAVGPDKRKAAYSFFGDRVDVAAPGGAGAGDSSLNVVSAAIGGGARADFGTSFAAPHVAAIAALILSAGPTSSVDTIREAIRSTAVPLLDHGLGHGLVDARAAMEGLSGTPSVPTASGGLGLAQINTLDQSSLVARFSLSMLTASIVMRRRPFSTLNPLRGLLGMTEVQFNAIRDAH